MYLITRQLKHWLPSKMLALNYSITHCIRHSYSYCTANGRLEDQEQQFFYSWTRCILVAGEYVKKLQNTTCISSGWLCRSTNFLNAPRTHACSQILTTQNISACCSISVLAQRIEVFLFTYLHRMVYKRSLCAERVDSIKLEPWLCSH